MIWALANLAGPAFPEADAAPYVRQMTDKDPQTVIDELVAAGFLKREDGNICITYEGRLELRKPRGKPPKRTPEPQPESTPEPPIEAASSSAESLNDQIEQDERAGLEEELAAERAENERLRTEIEAVRSKLENGAKDNGGPEPMEYGPGPQIIPEPEDEPVQFDPPASNEETLGEIRTQLQNSEAPDRDKLIFSMSDADRAILTEKFRREINETTNEKIRGVRLNPYDEEQYELKLAIYHALARRGDKRS